MKRKNKIEINYIIKKFQNLHLIIVLIILYFFIHLSYENKCINRKLDLINEITMTIKEIGEQYIIGEDSEIIPNEIYVNGEKQNTTNKTVNLVKEENIIILKWDSPVTDCSFLFDNLNNISKIDLSKFDSTSITNAFKMFSGCSKLTTIIFDNFNTSLIQNMSCMFYECSLLTSLKLTMFITTKVKDMSYMFQNCSSLKGLDLSNFITSNVIQMDNMFYGCSSLIYLHIDNFDTSLVESMKDMFYDCSSLISLDLYNFNISKISRYSGMLYNVNENITFCISSEIGNFTINCSDICFTERNIKIVVEKKKCLKSCLDDDDYSYEYGNVCYENCPSHTYVSSDITRLCKNKNEGFYYFDNYIYKSCYLLCDSCNKDENIYNCLECISNKGYRNNYVYLNCIKCDEKNIFYQKSKECLDCIYNNKYANYYQYKCIWYYTRWILFI